MNLFIQFSPHWTFKQTDRKRRQQAIGTASKPWQGPSHNETENDTYMQPTKSRKLKPTMRRFSAWFSDRLRKSKGLFHESRCMRQDVWVKIYHPFWNKILHFNQDTPLLIKIRFVFYACCLKNKSEKCKYAYSGRVSSGSNASWVRSQEVSVKQWRTIHYKTSGRGRLLALVVC